jgi:hypothetical protein
LALSSLDSLKALIKLIRRESNLHFASILRRLSRQSMKAFCFMHEIVPDKKEAFKQHAKAEKKSSKHI